MALMRLTISKALYNFSLKSSHIPRPFKAFLWIQQCVKLAFEHGLTM